MVLGCLCAVWPWVNRSRYPFFVIKLTIWITDASESNVLLRKADEVATGSLVIEKGGMGLATLTTNA